MTTSFTSARCYKGFVNVDTPDAPVIPYPLIPERLLIILSPVWKIDFYYMWPGWMFLKGW